MTYLKSAEAEPKPGRKVKPVGCVYILSNPSFRKEWLKIGKTEDKTPFKRMQDLYNTSVPLPFECLAYLITEDFDCVEQVLHKQLEKYFHKRINANREFFSIDGQLAIEMLKDAGELVRGELKLGPFKTTSQRTAAAINIKIKQKDSKGKAKIFFGHSIWGDAKLAWDGVKTFTVLAGSHIRTDGEAPSLGASGVRNRKENGKLYMPDGVLKQDIDFSSPSGASDFVCGTPTAGTTFWTDANGKKIKEFVSVAQTAVTKAQMGNPRAETKTAREGRESAKRAPFRFSDCGIKPGERVCFKRDPSKFAIIVDDHHIRYGEKVTSLSALAKQLLGRHSDVQGPLHFTYNGEVLDVIRSRKQRF